MELALLATLKVDLEARTKFRSGILPREWKAQYPDLFDDDDLRLALSQPNNHFFEWCGARYLLEEKGYLSLLEKYQYKSHTYHKQKQRILENLKFEGLHKAIAYSNLRRRQQLPDLLAYKPDFSDWFFCEIKGGTDKLRDEQVNHFRTISELSNKRVYWIKIDLLVE